MTFVTVNSGGYSCYAIDSSGTLWAWGGNQNGQLGTGSSTRGQTSPADVGIHLAQVSSTASNVAGLQQHTNAGDPRPLDGRAQARDGTGWPAPAWW